MNVVKIMLYTMETYYTSIIESALQNSEHNHSKITDEILGIQGMTGSKTRHFYNNLLNFEDARYLEIGTWIGSSVCSAMYGNAATVVCIDNWSEFNDDGSAKLTFLQKFEQFKGENKATFIESNSFSVDTSILPKFNVYMYDGNHSYDSHELALSYFYKCLDDVFIFVVDDWNWEVVQTSTKNSIQKLNLKILYEKEILTKETMDSDWWNGMYVCLLQKQ